ncbi:MAG: hypothetical protein ACT4OV_13925 [Microthrixaceae bacterium]
MSSDAHRRAASSLIGGRLVGALFASAWLVLAARALAPADFGRLAVVIGVGTVAAVVVEGGYPLLVAEAVGAEPRRLRAVVRGALAVRLPLAVGAGAATVATAAAIWGRGGAGIASAYAVWIVASAALTTLGPALRAVGRAGAEGAAEAMSRVLTLLIGAALLAAWSSPVAVALAYGLGTSIAVGWLAAVARRAAPAATSALTWRPPLRRVLPLGLAAVLVTIYNRVDVWMLALLASTVDVGTYAAGYRFYEGLVLPATAFGALLVPAVAADADRLLELTRRHVRAAVLLAAVGATALAVSAPVVVRLLLGAQFSGSVGPIRVLAVAAIPASVMSVIAPLASLRARRAGTGILTVGIAAALGLNAILIPWRGPTGAAIAMVATQSLMALCFLAVLIRREPPRGDGSRAGTPQAGTPLLAAQRSEPSPFG